jgi:hypothetical protein
LDFFPPYEQRCRLGIGLLPTSSIFKFLSPLTFCAMFDYRDGNFTCGCGYRTQRVRAWVPFFTRGSDPHPPRESVGAGVGFIFHPWVTRGYPKFQIFIVSTPDPVNPPKFSSALKFWLSLTLSPTQVLYRNPIWHSSYSPTLFFSWFFNTSCPCD